MIFILGSRVTRGLRTDVRKRPSVVASALLVVSLGTSFKIENGERIGVTSTVHSDARVVGTPNKKLFISFDGEPIPFDFDQSLGAVCFG